MENKEEQPSYFAILTADVRYSPYLSDFEKLLFADITALTNKNGFCNASNDYFSKLFLKSKETISRAISKLEKLGFCRVFVIRNEITKQVMSRKIYININTPIDININTPIDININTPIDKNVKENNTSINKEEEEEEEKLSELEEDFITHLASKSDVNPAYLKKYKFKLRTNLKSGDEATCINFKKYVASKSGNKPLKIVKKASNTDDFIDSLFVGRELANA